MSAENPDSLRPYLWMLAGSFAFAAMGTLAHWAGKHCDWQIVAVARAGIPFFIIGLWAWQQRTRFVFFRPGILWMRSIAGSCSLIGTFYCLTRMPAYDVFTITNMFPIWVALLSWPMLGELPHISVWISVLSGVAGVAVIQQPHMLEGNSAVWVAVSVSVFTAFAMIGLHRLKGLETKAIVVHFSGVSLAFALAANFWFEHEGKGEPGFEPRLIAVLIVMGILASIGQIFLTKAFTYGDPARISVVGLSQIVFTLLLAAVLFGDIPDWTRLVGIPLVIVPTGWLMAHPRPRRRE